MIPLPTDSTLQCQDCGDVLRILSLAEAQRVADNPENFILLCGDCASYCDPRNDRHVMPHKGCPLR